MIVLERVGGVSEGNPAELHPLGEASFNVHDCGNDTQPITNETATAPNAPSSPVLIVQQQPTHKASTT